MIRLLVVSAALFALWTPTWAKAHLPYHPAGKSLEQREVSQERNLAHARYVCRRGGGEHQRWACRARGWLGRELAETRAVRLPRAWGPWAFPDPCLREISRRETVGTYSPTIWNFSGSGAYGIGQAKPPTKMARFGRDFMTNPWTQLRWMVFYVTERYGGSCAALAFHNRNGWY